MMVSKSNKTRIKHCLSNARNKENDFGGFVVWSAFECDTNKEKSMNPNLTPRFYLLNSSESLGA